MHGDQVRFVGIPGLANEQRMAEFVEETGTDFLTHIPDQEGDLWTRFGVTQQRTYVFINDDGTWRTSGYGSLQEDIEGLIAQ